MANILPVSDLRNYDETAGSGRCSKRWGGVAQFG